MKMSAGFFLFFIGVSAVSNAAPTRALLDFNISLSSKSAQSSNPDPFNKQYIVTHICSKDSVKKIEIVEAHEDGVNILPVKGCYLQARTYVGFGGPINLSLVDTYKSGLDQGIKPEDLIILVSTIEWKGSWLKRKPVYTEQFAIEPLSLSVSQGLSSDGSMITDASAPIQIKATTTVIEPLTNALYSQFNTPSILHQAGVMQKILKISDTRPLALSDFLNFESIYFATKDDSTWKDLLSFTPAELLYKGKGDRLASEIHSDPAFNKILSLSQEKLLNLYVAIYMTNLSDVVAINDSNPQAALASYNGNSSMEQLAAYQLERQKSVDFMNSVVGVLGLAGAGVKGGTSFINSILR